MTRDEFVYADTLNLLGSDVQPPEFETLLEGLHQAGPEPAVTATACWPGSPSSDRRRESQNVSHRP